MNSLELPMDATKSTPPTTVAPSNKLGEGSFGKVFANQAGKKQCATKHVKLNFGDKSLPFIHETTLREYAALAQCGGGYVPKLMKAVKFDVPNDNLELSMTHGGMTLTNYAKSLRYHQRIEFVPSLIYQMAQSLLQLQNAGILHGDIKPDNILVDEKTKKVRIIDFGIATFIQSNPSLPHFIEQGTYLYAPPESFESNEAYKNTCVWSIAMCVIDFLYKNYGGLNFLMTDYKDFSFSKIDLHCFFKMEESFKYLKTKGSSLVDISLNQALNDLKSVNPEIHSLVAKMIDLNPETRITLENIISKTSSFKSPYVKQPALRTTTSISSSWKRGSDKREAELNILFEVAKRYDYTNFLPLATLLLDQYLSKVAVSLENICLASLSCLSIAVCLGGNNEDLYKALKSSIFKPHTTKDLFDMHLSIVKTLKGRLYYKTFVSDIYEKHGAVNYNVANQVMLRAIAPYSNQSLVEMYESMCYTKI